MIRFAVVGPGRAGRARIAALEGHARARCVAVVAREGEPDFASVLRDPAVDAVCVCTPNALHAPQAEAALEAGKHVVVEFPLAPGPGLARRLLERARECDRVLHVEHIELLSASQRALRERAAGLGRPRGGELQFQGGNAGWIGASSSAGSPALRAVARLHRLVDLFGSARVASAALQEPRDGGLPARGRPGVRGRRRGPARRVARPRAGAGDALGGGVRARRARDPDGRARTRTVRARSRPRPRPHRGGGRALRERRAGGRGARAGRGDRDRLRLARARRGMLPPVSRLICLVLSVVLLACGDSGEPEPDRFRVALLTPGSIRDAGWNQSAYEGLVAIRDELGAEIAHQGDGDPAGLRGGLPRLRGARLRPGVRPRDSSSRTPRRSSRATTPTPSS